MVRDEQARLSLSRLESIVDRFCQLLPLSVVRMNAGRPGPAGETAVKQVVVVGQAMGDPHPGIDAVFQWAPPSMVCSNGCFAPSASHGVSARARQLPPEGQ